MLHYFILIVSFFSFSAYAAESPDISERYSGRLNLPTSQLTQMANPSPAHSVPISGDGSVLLSPAPVYRNMAEAAQAGIAPFAQAELHHAKTPPKTWFERISWIWVGGALITLVFLYMAWASRIKRSWE